MAGRLYKPKAKSFWILVRRLLLRKKNRKPPAAAAAEEEKSGLLGRSSLEALLLTDDDANKHGLQAQQQLEGLLPAGLHRRPVMPRSEAAAAAGGGRGGEPVQYRRFMFSGFRRRLLMRRPWRPMLVAIPE